MLPKGFALEAPKKHNKKDIEHPTSKKFFTNVKIFDFYWVTKSPLGRSSSYEETLKTRRWKYPYK